MAIKLISKKSLSSDDKKKLSQRTLRGGSYMQDILANRVQGIQIIVIAQDTEAKGNDYVGWGYVESGTSKNDNYIGIFVAPHKRRKGIGTDIVRTLLKKTGLRTAQVQAHDKRSAEFYSKGGYKGGKDYPFARISSKKYGL